MPDDTALVRSTGARSRNDLLDGGANRVELVVAGDLLDQTAIVLEEDEVAQVVEQQGRCQHATDQGFQFVELAQWVKGDTVDGAPLHEAFGVG